jgi:hypothetical protein
MIEYGWLPRWFQRRNNVGKLNTGISAQSPASRPMA